MRKGIKHLALVGLVGGAVYGGWLWWNNPRGAPSYHHYHSKVYPELSSLIGRLDLNKLDFSDYSPPDCKDDFAGEMDKMPRPKSVSFLFFPKLVIRNEVIKELTYRQIRKMEMGEEVEDINKIKEEIKDSIKTRFYREFVDLREYLKENNLCGSEQITELEDILNKW